MEATNKKFLNIQQGNPHNYGLTELNVAESLKNGFMNHPDWVGHAVRYGIIQDWVDKNHPSTILDVGCGRLNLIIYLWRNRSMFKGTYTGLDLRASEGWLDAVNWKHGLVNLIKVDVVNHPHDWDLTPNDVVVCTEVLEHVPKAMAPRLLENLYRWTKPGGYMFLSSPNAGVSKSIAANHVGPEGPREWEYEEKVELGRSVGFRFEWAMGSFIQTRKIPEHAMKQPIMQSLRQTLPYNWFVALAAGPFPRQANNSIMLFRRMP